MPVKKYGTWEDFETAFLNLVGDEYENGCWIWIGAGRTQGGKGYGSFRLWGKTFGANQASWMIFRREKEFPKGLYACHTCDNKLCVNPDHIYAGTASQNVKDAWKARRLKQKPKEQPPKLSLLEKRRLYGDSRCILNEEQVVEMKRLRSEERISYRKIGERFGVSEACARLTIQGKRWAHLTGQVGDRP